MIAVICAECAHDRNPPESCMTVQRQPAATPKCLFEPCWSDEIVNRLLSAGARLEIAALTG
jgi:hypothetical protein